MHNKFNVKLKDVPASTKMIDVSPWQVDQDPRYDETVDRYSMSARLVILVSSVQLKQ